MTKNFHTSQSSLSHSAGLWMRRWLVLIGVMVYAMILVGGATRLTDSGLSITEWKPISGAIPPTSEAHWDELFDLYQDTAEFRLQNSSMSLEEFKYIYWWEWGHRQLGRWIGVVAIAGFLIFLKNGWLKEGWGARFGFLIILGGLQGAIGWWMVASGIGETTRVDVAPYRLMTHFCLALFIIGVICWYWMRLDNRQLTSRFSGSFAFFSMFALLIFFQMASGALVAGLDAGRTYTDWPLMAGQFVPSGYVDPMLGLRNPFENIAMAQFNHRMLAYLIGLIGVGLLVRRILAVGLAGRYHAPILLLSAAIVFQILWGIFTLVNVAPLSLALVHQGVGVIVLILAIRTTFKARYQLSDS